MILKRKEGFLKSKDAFFTFILVTSFCDINKIWRVFFSWMQDHPNIIKLHEIWEWNDVCFLVLEYCSGGELFHYILNKKHLSEKDAAMIMK